MSFKNWLFCSVLQTFWANHCPRWWQGTLPMQRGCPDFLTGLIKCREILFLLWWLKRISLWSAFQAGNAGAMVLYFCSFTFDCVILMWFVPTARLRQERSHVMLYFRLGPCIAMNNVHLFGNSKWFVDFGTKSRTIFYSQNLCAH